RSIYGERLAFEVHPHDFEDQRLVNVATMRVAYEQGVPCAAVGDVHMPVKEWVDVQDAMLKLGTGSSNLEEEKKRAAGEDVFTMRQVDPTLYLMSEDEMFHAFASYHPSLPPEFVRDAVK